MGIVSFWKSCLFLLSLLFLFFWCQIQKKSLPRPMLRSISSMFYLVVFLVPGFTFKSLIHVQLIFGHGVDSGVVSLFCMWPSNFLNTICWRDCPFPYISLAPLLYINWTYMHEFIPGLSFWFHWGICLIFYQNRTIWITIVL